MKGKKGGNAPNKKEWLGLINRWRNETMFLHSWSWEDVLYREGEDGLTRKGYTVEKALAHTGSWTEKWFSSGQTDYSAYTDPDYLFALMFCHFHTTRANIKLAAKDISENVSASNLVGATILDYGGTIFTAVEAASLFSDIGIIIDNVPGPQFDFARWFLKNSTVKYENIFIVDEREEIPLVDFVFAFETFEHIQEPEKRFIQIAKEAFPSRFYFANSFCYPAHGHHIPITIGGVEHMNKMSANRAWRLELMLHGYIPEKVEGFNSRLWVVSQNH